MAFQYVSMGDDTIHVHVSSILYVESFVGIAVVVRMWSKRQSNVLHATRWSAVFVHSFFPFYACNFRSYRSHRVKKSNFTTNIPQSSKQLSFLRMFFSLSLSWKMFFVCCNIGSCIHDFHILFSVCVRVRVIRPIPIFNSFHCLWSFERRPSNWENVVPSFVLFAIRQIFENRLSTKGFAGKCYFMFSLVQKKSTCRTQCTSALMSIPSNDSEFVSLKSN